MELASQQGLEFNMPKGLQPIFRQVLDGTVGELSIRNIPQDYTDLILYVSARNNLVNLGADFNMQFNSEAGLGSNFASRTFLYGQKNASNIVDVTNQADMNALVTIYHPAASASANIFSNGVVRIPNYATSQPKQIIQEYALENNSAGTGQHILAAYTHLAKIAEPIRLIRIWQTVSGQLFINGTTFSLYGLNRA